MSLQINNNATVRFMGGGTSLIGGTSQTYFQRLFIQNGTLVNIATNTQVGGTGLLEVTGAGSQLGAASGSRKVLNIQGNTTMRLVSNGTMNDSALDFLDIQTGGNTSTATFTGNGNSIKCWNFEPVKTGSGGVVFSTNTPFSCKNNFQMEMGGTATFTDNANAISVGDDLRLKGDAARYNLTGTFVLTCANSGSGQADIEVESGNSTQAISAHLNNITINNTSNTNANVRFQPTSGSGTITIKNNFTIQNMPSGRTVVLGANTYNIGGNYLNQVHENRLNEGTATIVFNKTSGTQTISCTGAGGEVFYNVIKSNGGTATLNSGLTVTNDFTINSSGGIFAIGSGNPNLLIGRNWTNSGGEFSPSNGTVTFFGSLNSIINAGGKNVNRDFYRMEIDKNTDSQTVTILNTDCKALDETLISTGKLIVETDRELDSKSIMLDSGDAHLEIKSNAKVYVNP